MNVAVDAPARKLTVAGTVASPVSLLDSVTVSAPDVSPIRVTVPVVDPPFSEIAASSKLTLRVVGTATVPLMSTSSNNTILAPLMFERTISSSVLPD